MKLGQFLSGVFLGVHPFSHGRLVCVRFGRTHRAATTAAPNDSTASAFYLTRRISMYERPRLREGDLAGPGDRPDAPGPLAGQECCRHFGNREVGGQTLC